MRIGALFLVFVAVTGAEEISKDAAVGMDAAIRGDWGRALVAFTRDAAAEKQTRFQRERIRLAKARHTAFWNEEIGTLIKQKRWPDLAAAVAATSIGNPKHRALSRARKLLERNGVAVLEVPTPDKDRVAAYPNRSPYGRLSCWNSLGAPFGHAERLVDDCLDYLVRTQDPSGAWIVDQLGGNALYHTGATGLALLALVARGPEGLQGARGAAARRAAEFLRRAQDADGTFGKQAIHFHYNCAFALEALAEYAVVAGKTKELRENLTRGRDYFLKARNPGSGWRYDARSEESDTSITGRVLGALDRLHRAGVLAPDSAYQGAAAWVGSVRDEEFASIGYITKGGLSARPEGLQEKFPAEKSQAMTASGTIVLLYAGETALDVSDSLALVREVLPLAAAPDMYYWDLGARVSQAARGRIPRDWYGALVESAEAVRSKEGGIEPAGPWGPDGGRTYATAMVVLALTSPYREPPARTSGYLPSEFYRNKGRHLDVPGIAGEVPTGIYLDSGRALMVEIKGNVAPGRKFPAYDARGTKSAPPGASVRAKGLPFCCLAGRIGDGKPFRLESGKMFTTKNAGHLVLFVNDATPTDNRGRFTVKLTLMR